MKNTLILIFVLASFFIAGWSQTPVLKLIADIGVTKNGGDLVSQWDDQSGNNNHAIQNTVGERPKWFDDVINGKDIMRFDKTRFDNFELTTKLTLTDYTAFFVISFTELSDEAFLGELTNNINLIRVSNDSTYLTRGVSNFSVSISHNADKLSVDTYYIIVFKFDNDSIYVYQNGTKVGSEIDNNANYQFQQIGYRFSSDEMDGDIGEIQIYNTALSDAQRLAVEITMASYYNILSPAYPVSDENPWLKYLNQSWNPWLPWGPHH